ncbi:uncharacterized protein LOC144872337 [Branchiostoma floridae x Branchiostoma japonicum]
MHSDLSLIVPPVRLSHIVAGVRSWIFPSARRHALRPSVDCGSKPAGMYPDPQDCTMFYQCFAGIAQPFHMPCGPGTLFDWSLSVCTATSYCVTASQGCDMQADIIFVVDGSTSILPEDFEKVKTFLNNVVGQFDIGPTATQVGVVQYSSSPQQEFALNAHSSLLSLQQAIANIIIIGRGTSTGAALTFVRDVALTAANGARPGVSKIVVVVTDGASGDDVFLPSQNLRIDGVITFAIGVTNYVADWQLSDIAGSPDRVFTATDFDALDDIKVTLSSELCGDDDECADDSHNCSPDATCTNTAGSFTCACNVGYSGNGLTCTDDNECADVSHICATDATCTNTPGSFTCACNVGYSGDGIICTALKCPTLTAPAHGSLSPAGPYYDQDVVTFNCNLGYELDGAFSVTCQANNNNGLVWSDTVPSCRGYPVDCASKPAGMYPDPQDCTMFYQCRAGTDIPDHMPCAPGTLFDWNLSVCTLTSNCRIPILPPEDTTIRVTTYQSTLLKPTALVTKAVTGGTFKPFSHETTPTCTNEYMELALPAHLLSHVVTSGLHWDPDPSCKATFNGTHYILRTGLYECGTKVTFDTKYVIFYNNVSLLFTHDGLITRDPDVVIHSICKYERDEAVMSEFLPIPGGLEFFDEGFGQLSIRLDLFPTQSYLSPYTTPDYPVHKHLRDRMYLQLQVQGHARQLSVIALHCEATSGRNTSLQYPLIQDGCASDDTLQLYTNPDPATQRFSLEAFRFVQEVTTIHIRCEVEVCDAAYTGSRCAQGCRTNHHHKRALEEQDDMKSRFVISRGPIILDADSQPEGDSKTTILLAGGSAVLITLAAVLVAVKVRRSKRVHPGYQQLINLDVE